MNFAHLFEAGMLVCFGFSWPINVVKAYKAGTAKSTSLAFIFLIITGYVLGISAKIINHQFNYVLAVYVLNLVIVFSNVLVYFRNISLDKKREAEKGSDKAKTEPKGKVLYAHEEQIVLAKEFNFEFDLYNRSTFALSLKNAKEYFEKFVSALNSDGIILQLGKEDREIFKANPYLFDTMYLDLISVIKAHNKDCRLALVSVNNSKKENVVNEMNNHIKAIAQSEQAVFLNLENAKLWTPMSVQSSLDFAYGMGLNVKKPIYDVAEILYSYAAQNISEEETLMNMAV